MSNVKTVCCEKNSKTIRCQEEEQGDKHHGLLAYRTSSLACLVFHSLIMPSSIFFLIPTPTCECGASHTCESQVDARSGLKGVVVMYLSLVAINGGAVDVAVPLWEIISCTSLVFTS
jgi:hypothetical protein